MIQKHTQQASGSIDETFDPGSKGAGAFLNVLVAFNSAPTTDANVQVLFDSANGEDYDTIIQEDNPASAPAAESLAFVAPEFPMPLARDDRIRVIYTNPDNRQVSITVFMDDDYYAR